MRSDNMSAENGLLKGDALSWILSFLFINPAYWNFHIMPIMHNFDFTNIKNNDFTTRWRRGWHSS